MEKVLPRMYIDLMPMKYYKKIVVKDGAEVGLVFSITGWRSVWRRATIISGTMDVR